MAGAEVEDAANTVAFADAAAGAGLEVGVFAAALGSTGFFIPKVV